MAPSLLLPSSCYESLTLACFHWQAAEVSIPAQCVWSALRSPDRSLSCRRPSGEAQKNPRSEERGFKSLEWSLFRSFPFIPSSSRTARRAVGRARHCADHRVDTAATPCVPDKVKARSPRAHQAMTYERMAYSIARRGRRRPPLGLAGSRRSCKWCPCRLNLGRILCCCCVAAHSRKLPRKLWKETPRSPPSCKQSRFFSTTKLRDDVREKFRCKPRVTSLRPVTS